MFRFAGNFLLGIGIGIALFAANAAAQDTPERKAASPPAAAPPTVPSSPPRIEQAPLDAVVVFDADGNRSLYFPPGSFSMTDLDDFRKFLLKDQENPVPFVMHNVSATGSIVANSRAEMSIQFDLITSTLHPVRVPLNFKEGIIPMGEPDGKNRPLMKCEGGTAELTVDPKTGQYVAVITPKQPQQKHTLTLPLWLPAPATDGKRQTADEGKLTVSFPQSLRSQLQITIPAANIEAAVSQGYVFSTSENLEKQTTQLTVIGLRAGTEITWKKKQAVNGSPVQVGTPALLVENALIDVRLESRSTVCDATLPIKSITGSFDRVQIKLPPGAKLDRETTDRYAAVAGYTVEEPVTAEKSPPLVEVRFPSKTAGLVSVRLKTVQPFDSDRPDFRRDLSGFEVIGAERFTGTLAAAIPPEMRPNWEPVRAIRRTETGAGDAVSGSFPAAAGSRTNARFEILTQPFQLRVHVVTPQTRITVKPEYRFQISKDAAVLNARFVYTVSGAKTDRFVIQMPDTHWNCEAGPAGLADTLAVNQDDKGLLTIPLRNPADGTFTIELSATRSLFADDLEKKDEKRRIILALPQPQATWTEPAPVVILPASNVELLPVDDADSASGLPLQDGVPRTTGLTRQSRRSMPPAVNAAGSLQDALFYRTEPGNAVFVADLIHHTQKVSVSMQTDIRLDSPVPDVPGLMDVSQSVSYDVRYASVDKLYFLLPKSLDTAAVQIRLGNQPLEWRDAPSFSEPAVSGADSVKRKMIQLPDLMSRFQLTFTYSLPLPAASQPSADSAQFLLQFIRPENIPAAEHRVHILMQAGYKPELQEESKGAWEPFRETRRTAPAAAVYRSTQSPPNIALSFALSEKDVTAASVVDRAWLQTWLTGTLRQDRASYFITPISNSVTINLPPGAASEHSVFVRVDRKAVSSVTLSPGGTLTIPILPEQMHRSVEVSVDYRCSFEMRSSETMISLPSFPKDVLMQYEFWQIVLPPNKHIITPPAGWIPEFDWTWNGLFWGRTPSVKKETLGLEPDSPDTESRLGKASQYLYSNLHPSSRTSFRTADRGTIVFYSSGSALLIGLILIYIPQSRYAGSLLGLGIALLAVFVWQPDLTLLVLQASVFGVCLALAAGYLYRIFHRHEQWIPPYQQTWEEEQPLLTPVPPVLPPQPVLEVIMDESHSAAGKSVPAHKEVPTAMLLLFGICFFVTNITAGDNTGDTAGNAAGDNTGTVIQYRRWLIPAEKIHKAPFPAGKNIPIKREMFERYLGQFQNTAAETNLPLIQKTELKAKLSGRQLVDGQGTFLLQNSGTPPGKVPSPVPLGSITLPILNPVWNDGTAAEAVCDAAGAAQITMPPGNGSPFDKLRFQWSLPSRKNESREDNRNEIVFDIAVPPSSGTELQMELPAAMTLTSSAGLVFPPAKETGNAPGNSRTWTVLLGAHRQAVLTVVPNQPRPAAEGKTAIHQTVVYTITPQGLEAVTRFVFDKSEEYPEQLTVDIEPPLRPVEVQYGGQNVPWISYAGLNSVTKIGITLPPLEKGTAAKGEPPELTVRALAPLRENQRWQLPRLRAASPNLFWTETRCAVSVAVPLQTRHLVCEQGIQVAPRSAFDWTERQLFTFQYFNENGQIEIEIAPGVSQLTMNSITQIQWGNSEIRADTFLDCSVSEGERFTLDIPVTENWIIDSVTPYPPPDPKAADENGGIASWDILPSANRRDPQKTISIHLRRALRNKKPVALKLSCRLVSPQQNRFYLPQLSPIRIPYRFGEQHLIAAQIHLTAYSLRASADARSFNVPQTAAVGGSPLLLSGNVYPLNAETADIRFDLERMRPNYAAEITGNLRVESDTLFTSYRFRCIPADSPIERVFVHFTVPSPAADKADERCWTWTLTDPPDSGQIIHPRKIQTEELKTLTSSPASRERYDNLKSGETWEIRFDELQTSPFELSAVCTVPMGGAVPVPLASLPAASAQKGTLTAESLQPLNYYINNKNLHPVPIAVPPRGEYPVIKASYHYNPSEEEYRSGQVSLTLRKLTPEEQPVAAWCWSLRLDSLYEPEGIVRNKALFLIENQGKDVLRITLPRGIDRVSAVYRNGNQTAWQHDEETGTVIVTLPEKEKFVSVSMDYSYQDEPLTKKKKLRPKYPGADIPILAGNWISRFPPVFDVRLRNNVTENPAGLFSYIKSLNYLTDGGWKTERDTFSGGIFSKRQRQQEAEICSEIFFKEAADIIKKNPAPTWENLLGSGKILSGIIAKTSTAKQTAEAKLLIDKNAFAFLGITPASFIENAGMITADNIREKLFERAGLVLLAAVQTRSDRIKEYTLALTTPMTLSLNRRIHSTPLGHCVRLVPADFFGEQDNVTKNTGGNPMPKNAGSFQPPQWMPPPRWLSETILSATPWSAASQYMPQTGLTDDWNAYELPMNTDQNLYITHRQKFAALHWICFLGAVLITCRKPLSSPLMLIALLFGLELMTRSVASSYAGLPSGAFLGVLVSIGFALIRPKKIKIAVPLMLLTVSSIFCIENSLSAQIVTEKKEPYRVFFPTDAEGKITGETVYLPKEFFDILTRNTETGHAPAAHQWHITKAVYQGSLIRSAADNQLTLADDFKAVYSVFINASSVTITLPNLPAVPNRIYWDTKPLQDAWKSDPAANTVSLTLENETPGKHTLEIFLRPKAEPQEKEGHRVNFSVPKVPDAVLRLNVPPDAPPINVTRTLGAFTVNTPLAPMVTADLGQTDKVSICWADDPNRSGTVICEAEQYLWIKVKPAQIEMQALFRYQISGGKIKQLSIQTDPRWNRQGQFSCDEHPLVPPADKNVDIVTDMTKIEFPSPVTGTVTLRGDFVLRGFGGAYCLRVPNFRTLNTRTARSMLAVSADKNISIDYPVAGRGTGFETYWQGGPAGLSVFALNEPLFGLTLPFFGGRRSGITEPPAAEYDLSKIESGWFLNIRNKNTVPSVKLTQSVLLNTGVSKWETAGEIDAPADVFQHSFTADESMQIEKIEVRDSKGAAVESRWFPAGKDNRYVLFLKRPVKEKYTVLFRGIFVTETGTESKTVPLLTLNDVQTAGQTLNLFRMPSVMSEVYPGTENWVKSETAPVVPASFSGAAAIGSWNKQSAAAAVNDIPPHFTLSSNNPKVRIKTHLTFQHKEHEDAWQLAMHGTAEIADGEIKTLSFRWDERCGTISKIEPEIPWSIDDTGGGSTLILHPAEPMRGKQEFKITAPVSMHGAAAVIPAIFPVTKNNEYFESEVFIDLPKQLNGEKVVWNLRHLEPLKPQPAKDRYVLRAVNNEFHAAAAQAKMPLTASLYDIGFLVKLDGSVFGVVSADLKNREQNVFVLKMPDGYEPIQISADGAMVQRTQLDRNRWSIYLGANGYPQRFRVLFRASLPEPPKQWAMQKTVSALQFPVLEDITVQETIWSVSFEGNLPALDIETAGTLMKHQVPLSGAEAVQSIIGLNLLREYHLLRLLNSVPSSKTEDLRRWYSHWASEWETVADKIDYQMPHLPLTLQNIKPKFVPYGVDSVTEKERPQKQGGYLGTFSETIIRQTKDTLRDSKLQSVTEKIGTEKEGEKGKPLPVLASQVYWQGRISADLRYFFGHHEGTVQEITFTSLPEEIQWAYFLSDSVRFLTVSAFAMPVMILLLIRWVSVRELWLQFPHFWGMSFGILLWVFVPDSFVGLAVMGLTAVSFFRPSWKRRLPPGQKKNG